MKFKVGQMVRTKSGLAIIKDISEQKDEVFYGLVLNINPTTYFFESEKNLKLTDSYGNVIEE